MASFNYNSIFRKTPIKLVNILFQVPVIVNYVIQVTFF